MTSMRALTLVADRKLELRETEAPPPPAAGEVQVRVKAADRFRVVKMAAEVEAPAVAPAEGQEGSKA